VTIEQCSATGEHIFEHLHGGLTPPALVLVYERLPAKNEFSDAQTHAQKERRASARRGARHRRCAVRDKHCSAATEPTNKSGGRQPAVGVSNAAAMADAFVQRHEREPAMVLVGRAWRMVWGESPASAFLEPRGAYAPRSWRGERCSFSEEITPFAMHKRTFARAAGVSPPWVRVMQLQWRTLSCSATHRHPAVVSVGRAWRMVWEESHSRAFLEPRGAYAPRSWLHVRTPLQMGDFRRGE
jgi:hypothetical protein